MTTNKLYRAALDDAEEYAPVAYGIPGKLPATARLSGGPRFVFRVESAEAAHALAGAFGARDGNGVAQGADVAVDRAAGSSGQALPSDLRERFESSLGADLAGVRLHTGGASAEAAGAVGAKAYTTGNDIHFGAGHYDPSSAFGVHLIAHEVAHTVQQQGGPPTRQHKLEVSAPQDAAEVEADRAADAMVAGQAAVVGGASRALARDPAPAPAGPIGAPAKATLETTVVEKGPFKVTLSASTDTDGNQELAVNGSVSKSFGPFPIGATGFFYKFDIGGQVSGVASQKKDATAPDIKLQAKLTGTAVIQGGLAPIGVAYGGGELAFEAPDITLVKSGSWDLSVGGPIAVSLTPIVGIESAALGAKYQVDITKLALAEITVSPLGVKAGADVAKLGAQLAAVKSNIDAVLIMVGAKKGEPLRKLAGSTTASLAMAAAQARLRKAAEDAETAKRHAKDHAEYDAEHNPKYKNQSSEQHNPLDELDRCEPAPAGAAESPASSQES